MKLWTQIVVESLIKCFSKKQMFFFFITINLSNAFLIFSKFLWHLHCVFLLHLCYVFAVRFFSFFCCFFCHNLILVLVLFSMLFRCCVGLSSFLTCTVLYQNSLVHGHSVFMWKGWQIMLAMSPVPLTLRTNHLWQKYTLNDY